MRLSIRTKILAAFGLLTVLFLVMLFTGGYRLRRIGSGLKVLQAGYLPIAKTLNSFFHFYHLDESFDANKMIANQSNRLFLDAVSIHNPGLLESSLKKSMAEARAALAGRTVPGEQEEFGRIPELIEEILATHQAYTATLRSVMEEIRAGEAAAALEKNGRLVAEKQLVRARISYLANRIDARIRRAIADTAREERTSVLTLFVFSAVTLLVSFLVGLVAIFALRPLRELKQAAREIAAGELEKRLAIRAGDEVGDLAREFNRMADAIQERDRVVHEQQGQLLQSERMAVIGRMASRISHEVRNPLNALSLNVELLADDVKGERPRKTLRAISAEIDRLREVTERYLALARSKRQALEDTDVSSLLAHVISLVGPECAQRGLKFEAHLDANLPRIRANASQLEQAFLNLIRNSMEASERGQALGLRTRGENGLLVVEVWDRGPGIPPEALPHIFEPFFTTKEKGTGLGLAITHEIVRLQGGAIECRSEAGGGTCFTVKLPPA